MVGGSIKSYLLKRVSTVRIRPGAPEICRARYTATVPGSSGLKAGFGPSTPASLISPRGEFSNPPGGTRDLSSPVHRHGAGLFWSKGRIRTVDTRVTHFPAGGVFESARGHQRFVEPGTTTVPGSSGSCHVKNEAPACWGSKRAPVSEYVCGESRNERLGCD